MQIHIDFETRSRVDIKKSGVHRYALDSSTDILCMAWMADGEPQLWLPGQPFPKRLHKFVRDESSIFCAWNATFEIEIWEKIAVPRHGFPSLSMDRWYDTMGSAAMCSFPLALDKCAKALGTTEQKGASGTRLINKLSKPRRDGTFLTYNEARQDYLDLYAYCCQDVRTEAEIHEMLPAHVNGREMEIQRLTWLINQRGVPIDHVTVRTIKARIDEYVEQMDFEVSRHTDGELYSARQRGKLKEYIDIELPNMQGETIKEALEGELPPSDRFLLERFQALSHTSVAKYKRVIGQLCDDGTVKSNHQYHGAGTGRDAARGFQLQNLPRTTAKDPDTMIKIYEDFGVVDIDRIIPVLEGASRLIRSMITAPPGKKLIVSDFNQVEAAGTAWAAKEQTILQNFRDGVDPYIAQASDMYHVEKDEVDSLQRQYGKIAILACGYQGSHRALTDFAAIYQLELERKEAVEIVRRFRNSRPLLVSAWYSFSDAALNAVHDAGLPYQPRHCAPCIFQMEGEHLTMKLPSGRKIWYPYAKVERVTVKYEDADTGEMKTFETTAVTCMWVSSYTHKWERRGMSGGNFFQNYVQAICRDFLMEAHIRCEQEGYEVVARVHDELVAVTPDDARYTIGEMNRLMKVVPEWAADFPLNATGYESYRYKK